MTLNTEGKRGINSLVLRILGTAAYVCDAVWTYIVPGQNWVMQLHWLAFPIFAFLLVEGFNKTSDRSLYGLRLAIFAAVSEVPYNLMVAKAPSFSRSQNVMFTLFLGFVCLSVTAAFRNKYHNMIITGLAALFTAWGGSWLADNLGFDMGKYGIIVIMLFYVASMAVYEKFAWLVFFGALTAILASDFIVSPVIGGYRYMMPAQAFSLIAVFILWHYNKDRGPNSLALKRVFYLIYPAVCLAVYFFSK